MVDPSETLANDHAYDAQSCGLADQMPEFCEHGFETETHRGVRELGG
jgi:hypothetical protein